MKFIKYFLVIILVLYTVACTGLYLFQDRFLFLADKLPEDHRFRLGEEIEIKVEDDIYLNALLIKTPTPKGVILYLHGTKGSNRRCLRQATKLTGSDYDIFMPDYRGYGKSDGKILSENQLYSDMQKVYDYLKPIYGESNIVLVGYSLGTGMASFLAAHNQPKRLILNSAFQSICDIKDRRNIPVPDFLVKFPLSNEKHLKKVTVPTTIFHGTDDEMIPYDSAVNLAKINSQLIELIQLPRTGHRRAIFSDIFSNKVRTLLRSS